MEIQPTLERVKHTPVIGLFLQTILEWQRDNTGRQAAALSYYTILSIAPLLLIVIWLIGQFTSPNTVQGQVQKQLSDLIGANSAGVIHDMIASINQSRSGLLATLFGIATLLYAASNLFAHLRDSLNAIWGITPAPKNGLLHALKKRLISFVMIPLIGLLLLASLVIDTVLSATANFFSSVITVSYIYILHALNFGVSVTIITLLFALIYRYLPDADIEWKNLLVGAATTAFLFSAGQLLISFYLGTTSTASTYGAAGSVIIILLWIYYSAHIFFFGAEFTQVYAERHGDPLVPSD